MNMRKITLLVICIISILTLNAQESWKYIGKYYMSFNYKYYDIYEDSKNVYIQIEEIYMTDDVYIVVDKNNINTFKSDLRLMYDTVIWYDSNKDINRQYEMMPFNMPLHPVTIEWYSNENKKWYNVTVNDIQPFCHTDMNSVICIVIDSTRPHIRSYFSLTADEINEILILLNK